MNEKERIIKALSYINHELEGHIKLNDTTTWNLEFYTNGTLDYKKICERLLSDIRNILTDKKL